MLVHACPFSELLAWQPAWFGTALAAGLSAGSDDHDGHVAAVSDFFESQVTARLKPAAAQSFLYVKRFKHAFAFYVYTGLGYFVPQSSRG